MRLRHRRAHPTAEELEARRDGVTRSGCAGCSGPREADQRCIVGGDARPSPSSRPEQAERPERCRAAPMSRAV